MYPKSGPLVSVVTPVYNGAEHLEECVESVRAQTYQNWDYTIVDNCSTDGSAEIARRYATMDPRIRVLQNEKFLRVMPNHNFALRQISPDSKYCKVVFADDWIYPRCLEEMVSLAERNPSVGIVGAYGLQNREVMWAGLPYPSTVVPGYVVCRLLFLEDIHVFGTPNSLLYRSDLVRTQNPFYNENNLHADMEACLQILKRCDFGFVHQILTFKRVRPDSLGMLTADINTLIAGRLYALTIHGRDYLTSDEYSTHLRRHLGEYYNFLAVSLLRGRYDRRFWEYHKRKLVEASGKFSWARLIRATIMRLCRAILNPNETMEKLEKGRNRSRKTMPQIKESSR